MPYFYPAELTLPAERVLEAGLSWKDFVSGVINLLFWGSRVSHCFSHWLDELSCMRRAVPLSVLAGSLAPEGHSLGNRKP